MRFRNECNDKRMCSRCNNQIIENIPFEAKLNLLKGQAPNEFDHMFPCFKEQDDLFVVNYLNSSSIFICCIEKSSFYFNKFLFNK